VKVLLAHLTIFLLQRKWPLLRTRPIGDDGDDGDDVSMLVFDLTMSIILSLHGGLWLAYSSGLEELSSLRSEDCKYEDIKGGGVGKDLYSESELGNHSSTVA
jgi:hypothetical protein